MLDSGPSSECDRDRTRRPKERNTTLAGGWTYRLWYGSRQMELAEGKLTVGRSRHCDLSIQEPSISRKHVFMAVGSGEIRLQDLGSSNGTYVNEVKVVGESALHDGDHLRLGNAELGVEIRRHDGGTGGTPPEPPLREEPSSEGQETEVYVRPPAVRRTERRFTRKRQVHPLLEDVSLPDDPDAEETKHLDSAAIAWDVLQVERAGFWTRLAAVAADGLWVSLLAWAGYLVGGLGGALVGPAALGVSTWLGWAFWGTTPGKRLFGLYVFAFDAERPDRPGTGLVVSAIRVASSILSILLFGLGFLAIAFSPSRQALHDRLAATFVAKKPGSRAKRGSIPVRRNAEKANAETADAEEADAETTDAERADAERADAVKRG